MNFISKKCPVLKSVFSLSKATKREFKWWYIIWQKDIKVGKIWRYDACSWNQSIDHILCVKHSLDLKPPSPTPFFCPPHPRFYTLQVTFITAVNTYHCMFCFQILDIKPIHVIYKTRIRCFMRSSEVSNSIIFTNIFWVMWCYVMQLLKVPASLPRTYFLWSVWFFPPSLIKLYLKPLYRVWSLWPSNFDKAANLAHNFRSR